MMKGFRRRGVTPIAALLVLPLLASPALAAGGPFAAQGSDLWGGPGARGTGVGGARFDTVVHVSSGSAASGSVDFWAGGSRVASSSFSIPAQGAAGIPVPDALVGAGAFLYRVQADATVAAWSDTYNETPAGRFGVSYAAFPASEFLAPGDEADGGGADASSSTAPGRARTNVGVLCNPGSAAACQVEVGAFDGGAMLGTGLLNAAPGAVSQASLATLVPASAERPGLWIRLRVLAGSGAPYAIRNDNLTSDGTAIPLSVLRGSFSTAPVIGFFSGTPLSGCSPLSVSLSWATTGASRVTISGVGGDLPPTGTATATVQTTTDLFLTAFSASGQTATQPLRVTVQAPGISPTPVPASGTTLTRGTITGLLPVAGSNVTVTFLRQDSTGSTFVVNGNAFTYTAGTATGTDVVQLSTPAACGTATGTFTATVTATPGPPKIVSFIADPATSCRLNNNIMLHWVTENATSASIDAATEPIPTSGAYGFSYPPTDLDPSKTYVLTANGPGGKSAKASLTVKVDASLEYPTVSPASATVHSQDNLGLTVGGVVNTQYLNLYVVQMPSGGSVYFNSVGSYTYHAGMVGGVTDIIWITYHNGCGTAHAEFRANVIY